MSALSQLSILHAVPDLHPHSGGTSRVVIDFTDALAGSEGVQCSVVTQGHVGAPILESSQSQERVCLQTNVAQSSSRLSLALGLPFRHALHDSMVHATPALIHSHGLWLPVNYWTASIARKYEIPYVIQPHGMLEPWALQHKGYKKRIAMTLFQWRALRHAKLLVATALAEYENIRALGLRQPVALIPNGLDIDSYWQADTFARSSSGVQRTALFLSRVHPKKGLLNLMQAWAALPPGVWRLRIVGPDEGGHWAEVKALADRLGVGQSVEYLGPLEGEQKLRAYRESDLFVLPSYSENFGVVIAEALASGLPVITTRATPWADLEIFRCGWWVDVGVEPLLTALREAMTMDATELSAMGARGRTYVQRYDWKGIAPKMVEVYLWMLGQGDRPSCVLRD